MHQENINLWTVSNLKYFGHKLMMISSKIEGKKSHRGHYISVCMCRGEFALFFFPTKSQREIAFVSIYGLKAQISTRHSMIPWKVIKGKIDEISVVHDFYLQHTTHVMKCTHPLILV